MSVDKRQVATDALETLGSILVGNEKRDAIHLAVEPATAAHALTPGQEVGFVEGGMGISDRPVGIVDPFLKGYVDKGQRFWCIVYPRRITSLRHVWSHPDFPEEGEVRPAAPTVPSEAQKAESEWRLRNFIQNADCPDYETVINAAIGRHDRKAVDEDFGSKLADWGDGDRYLYFSGWDAHGSIPPVFWDHVEVVTGVKVPPEKRAQSFSCSC